MEDAAPILRGVSRLLQEFALCCVQSLFAGIDAACRQLPQITLRGVAILALQQHTRRGTRLIDNQNYYRAAVMNDIATSADASGFLNVVGGHREDRPTIYRVGRNQSCLVVCSLDGTSLLCL